MIGVPPLWSRSLGSALTEQTMVRAFSTDISSS